MLDGVGQLALQLLHGYVFLVVAVQMPVFDFIFDFNRCFVLQVGFSVCEQLVKLHGLVWNFFDHGNVYFSFHRRPQSAGSELVCLISNVGLIDGDIGRDVLHL